MNDALKELLNSDVSAVFLCDFADLHNIDGTEGVPCVIDTDVTQGFKSDTTRYDGTFKNKITLFIAESFFAKKPAYSQVISVDKARYRVISADLAGGMYEIVIEAVK
jgi:hypothetical protein